MPLSFGKAPFFTSSGRVVDLAPGDVVQILDPCEYRVLRINTTSQNVTLKKINAPKHRAFVRPASQIWVTPPLTSNMSVHVNEPTPNCLCSPPLSPPVLPDTIDVSVEATLDSDEALDLLASEFCNVPKLQQGFEEARTAANNTFAVLEETVAEMRTKEEKIQELQKRLQVLNEENSALLARTLKLSEQISSLKTSAISSESYNVHKTMLLHQISTYPNTLEFAAESMFYDLLGCSPDATSKQISLHARHILKLIHPDKNPDAPNYVKPLVSVVSEAKNILQTPHLRKVYNCCGIDGVRRTQRNLRTCIDCDTFLSRMHDTY